MMAAPSSSSMTTTSTTTSTTTTASPAWYDVLRPRADERWMLRLHRAQSVVLTPEELVEIRASQRTFEGAYVRTALTQFGFALVVLKIFTPEFYSIGALFAAFGAGVLGVSAYRRHEGNRQFFRGGGADGHDGDDGEDGGGGNGNATGTRKFRTSGNAVLVMALLSLVAYATLMLLIVRLDD